MSAIILLSIPIYSFFFFFYCYGDHRDLHSFPTRRSSDLFNQVPGERCVRLEERALDLTPQRGDRKSTRLNSSHGYISYAVFCLKKKKITERENVQLNS